MPAVSRAQQRLMGMALAMKRGKHFSRKAGAAKRMAESMTERQLKDFAGGSMKGKPEHKR